MVEFQRGGCLPSQAIRQRVLDGRIKVHTNDLSVLQADDLKDEEKWRIGQLRNKDLEGRIQPASFEPILGEEIYELSGDQGVLTHDPKKTVWRRIKELPARARPKFSLLEPFVCLPGHAYLVPQVEKFSVSEHERIRMSPKSTSGRAFLHERMIADYHQVYNTISHHVRPNEMIKTWLLIEPTLWPVVIQAGLTLTQVRFFEGYDAKLTDREILAEHEKNPLFYDIDENGELVPGKIQVNNGLVLHTDGKGTKTNGVIGLRARPSSKPLDLTKSKVHDPEEWFDFILAKYKANIKPNDHILLATKEYMSFPDHLSGEVDRYSTDTNEGELDDAGFFDPRFRGQGVAEVRSKERRDRPIRDGDDLTNMQYFLLTAIPDKLYGQAGNNYQGQVGPRAGKQFTGINFPLVAKEYRNIEKVVLTQDSNLLLAQRRRPRGFEIATEEQAATYEQLLKDYIPHTRYDCEKDDEVLQIIPYCVIFGPDKTVFVYDRSNNPKEYTDWRLFDKRSIGVGGHPTPQDGPLFLSGCITREVEEEVRFHGEREKPQWTGTLYMRDTEVDTVHFAYVMKIHTTGNVTPNEAALKRGNLVKICDLVQEFEEKKHDVTWLAKTESWSKELIPQLPFLYDFKGHEIKL